jgi:hypothetical protein
MIDRDRCPFVPNTPLRLGTEPYIAFAIHSLFLTRLLEHFYPVASTVRASAYEGTLTTNNLLLYSVRVTSKCAQGPTCLGCLVSAP